MKNKNYTFYLLALCFTGLVLAISGAGIDTNLISHKDNWLVNINGHDITESELINTRKKLNNKLSEEETLSLMIDNTLLIQRANELGLIESDRVVKKAIVHSVVETTVRDAISKAPSEETLKDFYQSNIRMFTSPKQVSLSIAKFKTMDECNLHTRINETWLNNKISHPANQGPMTETLLNRQFGPSLSKEILGLNAESFINTSQDNAECLSIYIHKVTKQNTMPFISVKNAVLGEYRIQLRRKALSELLIKLKSNGEIILSNQVIGDTHEK